MALIKGIRQRSDKVSSIEEAEDGLAGMQVHDFCVHAHIEPDGDGFRVISVNEVSEHTDFNNLQAGQSIAYFDR